MHTWNSAENSSSPKEVKLKLSLGMPTSKLASPSPWLEPRVTRGHCDLGSHVQAYIRVLVSGSPGTLAVCRKFLPAWPSAPTAQTRNSASSLLPSGFSSISRLQTHLRPGDEPRLPRPPLPAYPVFPSSTTQQSQPSSTFHNGSVCALVKEDLKQ